MKKLKPPPYFSRKIDTFGQVIFRWIEKEEDHNHVLSNHWWLMFCPSWQLEITSISLAQFFVVT